MGRTGTAKAFFGKGFPLAIGESHENNDFKHHERPFAGMVWTHRAAKIAIRTNGGSITTSDHILRSATIIHRQWVGYGGKIRLLERED